MIIRKTITVPDFREYAKTFRDSDHWLPTMTDQVLDDVIEVIEAYMEKPTEWEDTESRIVVRLADLRVGVFSEWSDSSGHG